jgi:hypothetical protein
MKYQKPTSISYTSEELQEVIVAGACSFNCTGSGTNCNTNT